MLVITMLLWGSIGIFRRYIPVSSALLALIRGLIGAAFLAAVSLIGRVPLRNTIGRRRLILLIITGAMIGVNWVLLFEAYNYTTVPVATLCYYMQPTIVMLLSPVFFRERLTLRKWCCILLSAVGMILVSGVTEGLGAASGEARGIAFGLGSALFYSGVVILNKKLSDVPVNEKTVVELSAAAAVMIPYMLITGESFAVPDDGTVIILILIVGLIDTGVAYLLYFKSMQGVSVQSLAILSYIDPVSALLFSALFFPDERLTAVGIIGAILILGATVISEVPFKKTQSS